MNNKDYITVEQNINFAKNILVDSIYKSARLEGIDVTYNQVNDILNDTNVSTLTSKEIMKILGLRDAWNYLLNSINKNLDLGYLETLHSQIAIADVPYYELGKIRTENVLITGTVWRPELPDIEKLHKELTEIMSMNCCVEKAVTLMLWIMRTQPFKDGNKRVATLAANKVLIEGKKGVIQVPIELILEFKKLLIEYYESNDFSVIKRFIYNNNFIKQI